MKNLIHTLLAVVLVVSLTSIALARGAPTKQKAFTSDQIVAVTPAPVVRSVPPLTVGFDVIQNLSTDKNTLQVEETLTAKRAVYITALGSPSGFRQPEVVLLA